MERGPSPAPAGWEFWVTEFQASHAITWTERDGEIEVESPVLRFQWTSSRDDEVNSSPLKDFLKPSTNQAPILCLYLLVPGALAHGERAMFSRINPHMAVHHVDDARAVLTHEQKVSVMATHFQVSDVSMLEEGGGLSDSEKIFMAVSMVLETLALGVPPPYPGYCASVNGQGVVGTVEESNYENSGLG